MKRLRFCFPFDQWEVWFTPFHWSWPSSEECPCCEWNFYFGPFGIERKLADDQ